MNPVLTTFALNEAELNTRTCTGLAYPKAKLLIDTPVNTINARGGSKTDSDSSINPFLANNYK